MGLGGGLGAPDRTLESLASVGLLCVGVLLSCVGAASGILSGCVGVVRGRGWGRVVMETRGSCPVTNPAASEERL